MAAAEQKGGSIGLIRACVAGAILHAAASAGHSAGQGELAVTLGGGAAQSGGFTYGALSGDASFSGTLGSWSVTFEGRFNLSTLDDPGDTARDEVTGLLTLERAGAAWLQRIEIGDHTFGYDPFLVPFFERRGLSFGLERLDGRFATRVFAAQSAFIPTGLDDVGSSDAAFIGVGVDTRFDSLGFDLSFAAIAGRGAPLVGDPDGRGHGASLSAVWRSMNGAHEISATYAISRFDADGDLPGFARETGLALELRGEHGAPAASGNLTFSWSHTKIDPRFASYANPGYTDDFRRTELMLFYSRGLFSFDAGIAAERTNVLGLDDRPTLDIMEAWAGLAFTTPTDLTYSANLSARRERQSDATDPLLFPPFDTDGYDVSLSVSRYTERLDWSVAVSLFDVKAKSPSAADSRTLSADMTLGWQPSDATRLAATVQLQRTKDALDGRYTYQSIALEIEHAFARGASLSASADVYRSGLDDTSGTDLRLTYEAPLTDRASVSVFVGRSSGDFVTDAPFGGGPYAGIALTLRAPFSF